MMSITNTKGKGQKSILILAKKARCTQLLFFILLAALMSACNASTQEAWPQQTPSFPVFEVKPNDYIAHRNYPAVLEGVQDIEVRAKLAAYIQKIYVDEGQFVKKGQKLFQLTANELVQNTQASSAAIATEEANVHAAQIEVDRLKPLVDRDIISPVQLQTAAANLTAAKARLNQSKSAYQVSQANQAYMSIVSPVDGFIGKLNFREGSLVGATDKLPLTTVANTVQMYAYFSISEQELNKLTQDLEGANLYERLKSFPRVDFEQTGTQLNAEQGTIDASTAKVSRETGAIQLRAKFDNASSQLLSGNTGVIKIPKPYHQVIAVPASATFEVQALPMVYVLSAENTLKSVVVDIIDQVGRYAIIASGLKKGDKVLAQGVSKVYPNTEIVPQMVDMDSIANHFQAVFK